MEIPNLSFSIFPVDFQEKTMGSIAKVLKKSESLQLIAPSGAGNSMIAKAFIQLPEIKKKYFGDENYEFILLDGNLLLERNSLNLSRLLLSLLDTNSEVPSDIVLIQKQIEEKIMGIIKFAKLVIIIDHINELNFSELKPFFNNLANFHRKIEPMMQFILLSQKQLKSTEDLENFGQMAKLLSQNYIFTSFFNKKDSFWFIAEKEKQIGLKLTKEQTGKVFELTGGFPRTIKRLVEAIGRGNDLDAIDTNPNIDIPLSLHLEELARSPETQQKVPLLDIYLNLKPVENGENVGNLKLQHKLTKIEEKILKILLKNKDTIVERENGIESVWGKRAVNISDHAYDQIIHRLKKKLSNTTPKATIETVRGRGHSLHIS